MNNNKKFPKFIFFGSSNFSLTVLNTLAQIGIYPAGIITSKDKPKGRHLRLFSSPVKIWGEEKNIPVITSIEEVSKLAKDIPVFLIAAYGKILSRNILSIPKYGAVNIHPSLLPKYRGASPIQTALLNGDKKTGVTLMITDRKMDHGPILSQNMIRLAQNTYYEDLEKKLATLGAKIFAKIIPKYIKGKIIPISQNHKEASYTKLITKTDGLIDFSKDSDEIIARKVQAFTPWPGTYFFISKNNKPFRVIITQINYSKKTLTIKKVKPEGGREIDWIDFKRNFFGNEKSNFSRFGS